MCMLHCYSDTHMGYQLMHKYVILEGEEYGWVDYQRQLK